MKNNESKLFNAMLGVGLSASALFVLVPDKAEACYDPAKHPKIEKLRKGAADTFRYGERKVNQGIDYIKKTHDDHEYIQYQKNRRREMRELREQNRKK